MIILYYNIILYCILYQVIFFTHQTYLYSHYHRIVFPMLTGADITFIETLQ